MGIWSIDITLVHEWELDSILFIDCLFNLLVRVRFLIIELVARKGDYLEAPRAKSVVHLNQCEIIFLCEGSVRGHVHDNGGLFTFHVITHRALNEIDISYLNRLELLNNAPNIVRVLALFPGGSEAHTGLRVTQKYTHYLK